MVVNDAPSRLMGLIVTTAALLALGCSPNGSTADGWTGRASWCPATLPQEGTSCTLEPDTPGVAYAACEYGTQQHCSTLATCAGVYGGGAPTWNIQPPDPSCAGNPPSCPKSFISSGAATCTIGTSCLYATGHCTCSACVAYPPCVNNPCGAQDGGTGWGCLPWGPVGDGCPSTPVLLGTACTGNASCTSNSGQFALCVNGYWNLGTGGC